MRACVRHAEQRGLHLERRTAPTARAPGAARRVLGQPALPVGQPAVQAGVVRVGGCWRQVQASRRGRAAIRCRSRAPSWMSSTRSPRSTPLQPGEHRVDRGALLGDEQHLPAAGDHRGDQVGDRLALAGAWRAVDHQAAPGQHGARSRCAARSRRRARSSRRLGRVAAAGSARVVVGRPSSSCALAGHRRSRRPRRCRPAGRPPPAGRGPSAAWRR